MNNTSMKQLLLIATTLSFVSAALAKDPNKAQAAAREPVAKTAAVQTPEPTFEETKVEASVEKAAKPVIKKGLEEQSVCDLVNGLLSSSKVAMEDADKLHTPNVNIDMTMFYNFYRSDSGVGTVRSIVYSSQKKTFYAREVNKSDVTRVNLIELAERIAGTENIFAMKVGNKGRVAIIDFTGFDNIVIDSTAGTRSHSGYIGCRNATWHYQKLN